MSQFDPVILQRLVDGELELEQIQKLLQQADANPEHWQSIATALIEDQLWARSMRGWMADLEQDTSATTSTVVAPGNESPEPELKPDSRDKSAGAWFPRRLLLAALILVAAGIGFGLSQWVDSTVDLPGYVAGRYFQSTSDAPDLAENRDETPQPAMTPAAYQPVCHLEIPQGSQVFGNAGVGTSEPVPLFSVTNVDQFKRYRQKHEQHRQTPPDLFQQFRRAGYQVEENIEFVSGNLDEQRSFVVPVRKIRLVPSQ